MSLGSLNAMICAGRGFGQGCGGTAPLLERRQRRRCRAHGLERAGPTGLGQAVDPGQFQQGELIGEEVEKVSLRQIGARCRSLLAKGLHRQEASEALGDEHPFLRSERFGARFRELQRPLHRRDQIGPHRPEQDDGIRKTPIEDLALDRAVEASPSARSRTCAQQRLELLPGQPGMVGPVVPGAETQMFRVIPGEIVLGHQQEAALDREQQRPPIDLVDDDLNACRPEDVAVDERPTRQPLVLVVPDRRSSDRGRGRPRAEVEIMPFDRLRDRLSRAERPGERGPENRGVARTFGAHAVDEADVDRTLRLGDDIPQRSGVRKRLRSALDEAAPGHSGRRCGKSREDGAGNQRSHMTSLRFRAGRRGPGFRSGHPSFY
jgi:hypothetical protein